MGESAAAIRKSIKDIDEQISILLIQKKEKYDELYIIEKSNRIASKLSDADFETKKSEFIRDNIKKGDIIKVKSGRKYVISIGKNCVLAGDLPQYSVKKNRKNSNLEVLRRDLLNDSNILYNVYDYVFNSVVGIYVENLDSNGDLIDNILIYKTFKRDLIK